MKCWLSSALFVQFVKCFYKMLNCYFIPDYLASNFSEVSIPTYSTDWKNKYCSKLSGYFCAFFELVI